VEGHVMKILCESYYGLQLHNLCENHMGTNLYEAYLMHNGVLIRSCSEGLRSFKSTERRSSDYSIPGE
jgi:hypothetical protein